MDYQPSNLFISWKFYKASTPKQLEALLLKLQVSKRSPLTTTHPAFAGGQWTVWVLHDFSNDVRPEDQLKLNNGAK